MRAPVDYDLKDIWNQPNHPKNFLIVPDTGSEGSETILSLATF